MLYSAQIWIWTRLVTLEFWPYRKRPAKLSQFIIAVQYNVHFFKYQAVMNCHGHSTLSLIWFWDSKQHSKPLCPDKHPLRTPFRLGQLLLMRICLHGHYNFYREACKPTAYSGLSCLPISKESCLQAWPLRLFPSKIDQNTKPKSSASQKKSYIAEEI